MYWGNNVKKIGSVERDGAFKEDLTFWTFISINDIVPFIIYISLDEITTVEIPPHGVLSEYCTLISYWNLSQK